MNEKIYIKIKDGELYKTAPMYTGSEEVMVDFDDRWNVLGLSIVKYIDFKVFSDLELLKTI